MIQYIWIRLLCGYNGNACITNAPEGVQLYNSSGGMLTSVPTRYVAVGETKTLIHEFGHLYSAPDHYGQSQISTGEINSETDGDHFNSFCIYGEEKENPEVLENFTICDGCKARIIQNINKFNHN